VSILDLKLGENVEIDILKLMIEDVESAILQKEFNYITKHINDLVEKEMPT